MDHDIIEDFYGCYLLYSVNPKYKGQTYIGFTKDPNRRIQQHNKGINAGGAWKTSNKGPWEMVLVIHGFPNEISALRFEWAWQHPSKSRRLKDFPKKLKGESNYKYQFRIVTAMLRMGPWNRLPLTIQWLVSDHRQLEFEPSELPPIHMPIKCGPISINKQITRKKQPVTENDSLSQQQVVDYNKDCPVCHRHIKAKHRTVQCLWPDCSRMFHIRCLADLFLKEEKRKSRSDDTFLIPVNGDCPSCERELLWGDLIKHSKGCYRWLNTQRTTDTSQDL